MRMTNDQIIAAIDAEIGKLQKARVLLSSIEGTVKETAPAAKKPAKRRRLSAAARKRIGDAQRKRWAAVAAAKKTAKPAPVKKAAKKAPAKKAPVAKKAVAKKASAAKAKKAAPKTTAPVPAPTAS